MRRRVLLKFGGTALIAWPLAAGWLRHGSGATRRLTSRAGVHDYPLAKIPRKPLTCRQAIGPPQRRATAAEGGEHHDQA